MNNDYSEYLDMHIMQNTRDTECGRISTLGEVFLEYYLFDSSTEKDIKTFLESENLTDTFTETEFMDLMCGDAYLDDDLLFFIHTKLPFPLTLEKFQRLNFQTQNSDAYMINQPKDLFDKMRAQINKKQQLKKEKDRQKSRNRYWRNREQILIKMREYRAKNHDKILQRKREYWATNKDKINQKRRVRYPQNREKLLEKTRQWYHSHLDYVHDYQKQQRTENRDAIAERKKKCYITNKEHYTEYKKNWYQEHKQELAARDKERLKALKQKTEAAQKICAAYVFLINLRKTNYAKYLELYTKQQKPITHMLKTCPALQSMDITLCPFCNPDCENTIDKCCNQKVLSIPNALSELQIIANNLQQR